MMITTGGKIDDKRWDVTEKGGDISDKGLGLIHTVNDEQVGWSNPWYKVFFLPQYKKKSHT